MKPTKSEIQDSLKKLRGALSELTKHLDNWEAAEAAAAKFDKELATLGDPDFRDDAAIERVGILKQKLDLCRKAIERIRGEVPQKVQDLIEAVSESGNVAANCLREIADNRFETVVSCVLPFCRTRNSAEALAKQSEAVQSAEAKIGEFWQLSGGLQATQSAEQGIAAAHKIEALLMEASSKEPDLLQFLPFESVSVRS